MANAWALYLCGLTVYVCTPWVRKEDFGDEQRVRRSQLRHPSAYHRAGGHRLPIHRYLLSLSLRSRYIVRSQWREQIATLCSQLTHQLGQGIGSELFSPSQRSGDITNGIGDCQEFSQREEKAADVLATSQSWWPRSDEEHTNHSRV